MHGESLNCNRNNLSFCSVSVISSVKSSWASSSASGTSPGLRVSLKFLQLQWNCLQAAIALFSPLSDQHAIKNLRATALGWLSVAVDHPVLQSTGHQEIPSLRKICFRVRSLWLSAGEGAYFHMPIWGAEWLASSRRFDFDTTNLKRKSL